MSDQLPELNRRDFIRKAGVVSLGAGVAVVGGQSPCIIDSLAYITGGRLHYGTLGIDVSLGHAVVLQRIDTQETWMGVWKDGVQSWNAIKIFGTPNKANPVPKKRWSAWAHEPDTPAETVTNAETLKILSIISVLKTISKNLSGSMMIAFPKRMGS